MLDGRQDATCLRCFDAAMSGYTVLHKKEQLVLE